MEKRLKREEKTAFRMIKLYCNHHHNSSQELCDDCRFLFDYAHERLLHCPFGSEKPVCSRCPVHCYKRDKRETIRKIMRYSGPRMLLHHPVLALFHVYDKLFHKRTISDIKTE